MNNCEMQKNMKIKEIMKKNEIITIVNRERVNSFITRPN